MEPVPVFNALKTILQPYAGHLDCTRDVPGHYSLDTHHIMPNGKPLFFGAVVTNKRYVSFHLMPVYVNPVLLDGMSDGLHRRMQGKSCFNFTSPDEQQFAELTALTRAGFRFYQTQGYV